MGQPLSFLRTKDLKALSLLEIMLALAVLAILSLSLILILTGGLKLFSFSERADVANSLAKEMMERIAEGEVQPWEGTFDGRIPSEQIYGFPPKPYPSKVVGREYHYLVNVASQDERLWHLKVEVYEGTRRAASLESLLRK